MNSIPNFDSQDRKVFLDALIEVERLVRVDQDRLLPHEKLKVMASVTPGAAIVYLLVVAFDPFSAMMGAIGGFGVGGRRAMKEAHANRQLVLGRLRALRAKLLSPGQTDQPLTQPHD